jgi:hypothetical protein
MMTKKKRHKAKKTKSASARGPFMVGHPLNGLSTDIRWRYVEEKVVNAKARYAELMPKLLELVSRRDPFSSIALMAIYGLMGSPKEQGDQKKLSWESKIQQSHIEYLQALCLRNTLDKENINVPEPKDIQNFFDWIPELFEAAQLIRHPGTNNNGEEPEAFNSRMAIASVQEFIRTHTSVVRNWGYFESVTRISKSLFERIDPVFDEVFGLKLTQVINIFEGLVRRQEDLLNAHRKKIHEEIFKKKTQSGMVTALFETFPELHGDLDEFRAQATAPGVSMQEASMRVLAATDRFIPHLLAFDCEEIAAAHDIDSEVISKLFNWLSLEMESLKHEEPDALFLDNPVWLRPFIYLAPHKYFCPLPQSLMSFVFPIVDELVSPYPDLAKKLSLARATFLEDEVAALFEKALPGAQLSRGFKWREGPQQFESDLVIRYDTTVLLVEAKSGKVSWPALRGAPARMIDHIRTLIVEPSDQSGRLAERLQEDIVRVRKGETAQLQFPVPMEGVTCVMRLSVTLHDFATLQSVPRMLMNAGVLQNKYPLAPCMLLADLETMLDLFDAPYVRLHYLRRRAEMLLKINTIGDELDMLGFYLDTALDTGKIDQEKNTLLLTGYSARIDRYYTHRDEGIKIPKPQPNTSDWFKRLCEQLYQSQRIGWSEIACALLSVSPTDQRTVERQVRSIAERLKNGRQLKHDHDTIFAIPPGDIKQSIAFQVKRSDQPGYGAEMSNIARQSFETAHVERCAVIVVNALSADLTYLSVGVLTAPEKNPDVAVFL